jgi:hypothetical protein
MTNSRIKREKLTDGREINIPLTPKFITMTKPNGDTVAVPIEELSRKELVEIGSMWTEKLLNDAEDRRPKL